LRIAGLFSGIGGIELGFQQAGHDVVGVGDIDPSARGVLEARFPSVPVHEDVFKLRKLPACEVIAAGFPCQDLSQAGTTGGINGSKSGAVGALFKLLEKAPKRPDWVLIENVPFMLHLHGGRAMTYLTTRLEELDYRWAYRVVDTRAFGLPQRRRRVVLLAGRGNPERVLLATNWPGRDAVEPKGVACGFYWTEGNKGVGWAIDATPPLKGGSALGIPSAPAIWLPDGLIGTPDIRDAERLQGFQTNWTTPNAEAPEARGRGHRLRLVGNAVSVPVSEWIGRALLSEQGEPPTPVPGKFERWPNAAWGGSSQRFRAAVGEWPMPTEAPHLEDFLAHPLRPLSKRASSGFLRRARRSTLRFAPGFLEALERHIETASGPTDG
jgi:DNA (cytosine-5)-methyltransferase 1